MFDAILGSSVFLAIGIASARLYEPDHRSGSYRRDRTGRIASPRSFRAVYHWIRWSTVAFGVGALLAGAPAAIRLPWLAVHREPALIRVGLVVAVAGFALFVAAKRTLGRQYSPCFDAWLPTAIVRDGVYTRIRHPIYTANLITLGGLTLASGSLWLLANLVILAAYYARSARVEEAALLAALPDYRAYLAASGRFLPRLR